ncbi:HD domain-containing protein [Paracoccus caeni]|uniref:5'-deoxynucleotidase n=1 Tax=Paracoccus caeni TaxID=657651 RepID=A0A934VZA6_9RHOB|nr:HD domain-containing protein [Paracoccus caeni]MBK4214634.1 HD domain-containing protein [Paracoccus caeni]
MSDLQAAFDFLCEADRLKSVDRASVLMDLSRAENSAEHSWHVALYAMAFGASDRAIAMILLHDLVEIDTGDHPIHLAHDAEAVAAAELAAARRLFGMIPNGDEMIGLWQEFEAAETEDARFAKRMDHIQPLFQVLLAPTPIPEHLDICRDNMSRGRALRLRQEWPAIIEVAEALMAGRGAETGVAARLRFLAEADRLKSVMRAGRIHSGRRENSAEHSWHLALYALILAPLAGEGVEIGRVIRMLILHDLPEIDTGDVPIHSGNGLTHHGAAQMAAEEAAAARIFGLLPGELSREFRALWDEFEANETPSSIFANALDRAQPVMLNIACGGGTWTEYQVTRQQLQDRVGVKIQRGMPELWDWLLQRSDGMLAG